MILGSPEINYCSAWTLVNLWEFCTRNDDAGDDDDEESWHVYQVVCIHYLFYYLQPSYKLKIILPTVLCTWGIWGGGHMLYQFILDSGEKTLTNLNRSYLLFLRQELPSWDSPLCVHMLLFIFLGSTWGSCYRDFKIPLLGSSKN